MTIPSNPHSRWYHCLCCMPEADVRKNRTTEGIQASPGGKWDNGKFEVPAPTDAFKKEFEGK